MDETAGGHPCLFWISKEADRFGPCPEKNSMGTCMHGAYSCPHKTEEGRAAVGCTYPIQPPHYAGDSPVLKKPAKEKEKRYTKGATVHCIGCKYENCGPDRDKEKDACTHPDFGKTSFTKIPLRREGGCYEAKSKEFLPPSAENCPKACPYKKNHPLEKFLICAFAGKALIEIKECPTPVLRSGSQAYTISQIKQAIDRQRDGKPSEDRCQCFACPDGVMRCGIGDTACPHSNESFRKIRQCPQMAIPVGYLFLREEKKPAVKKPRTKKPYAITIKPVTEDAPQLIAMGRHYLTDCTGPTPQGSSGSQDTKENTIRSILQTLNIWQKKIPITDKDALFEDETGEFNKSDFFSEDGTLRSSP
jgi:hypothetical protein